MIVFKTEYLHDTYKFECINEITIGVYLAEVLLNWHLAVSIHVNTTLFGDTSIAPFSSVTNWPYCIRNLDFLLFVYIFWRGGGGKLPMSISFKTLWPMSPILSRRAMVTLSISPFQFSFVQQITMKYLLIVIPRYIH